MKKKNYRRKQKRTQKLEKKISDIIYGPSYLEMLLKLTNGSILAQKHLSHFIELGRSWQKELLGYPYFTHTNVEAIKSSQHSHPHDALEYQLLYFFPPNETDVTPRADRIKCIFSTRLLDH